MIINIFDVNSVLYSAHPLSFKTFPTGGITLLLRKVIYCLRNKESAILVLDSKFNKRKLHDENYKNNRKFSPSIDIQREYLAPFMENLGLPFHSMEGYEADDLISYIIDDLVDQDCSIVVHSSDKDLAMNVDIKNKVIIRPNNSKMPIISMDCYEYSVVRGERVLYNTLGVHKVVYGDVSDNISAMNVDICDNNTLLSREDLYNYILVIAKKNNLLEQLGKKSVILTIVDALANLLPESVIAQYRFNIELVYPLDRPVDFTYRITKDFPNPKFLTEVCNLFGLSSIANSLMLPTRDLTDQELDYLLKGVKIKNSGLGNMGVGDIPESLNTTQEFSSEVVGGREL